MGHGGQVQAGIGGSTGGRHHLCRVFQRLAGDDIPGPDVFFQQRHHRLTGRLGIFVARLIGSRRAGGTRQGEADGLGHASHGIGRELAAAGTRTRAGHAFELFQVLIGHVARRVLANPFKDIDHGHVTALELARQNSAAIHEHRRHVQAQHHHHHAGQ